MRLWRTLRGRLTASYILLALLLLVGTALVFSAAFASFADEVQRQRITQVVLQVRTISEEGEAAGLTPEQVVARLKRLMPSYDVALAPAPNPDEHAPNRGQFAGPEPRSGGRRFTLLPGRPELESITLPVPRRDGAAFGVSINLRRAAAVGILALYERVLITLGLALLLAVLLGLWLSRYLSRPLAQLTAATAAVAAGGVAQAVEPMGTAEIDALAEQFNAMARQVRESITALGAERDAARRLATDASHELRTPLAALRTYEEVLSEHPERQAEVVPALGRQVERMQRLIDGLMRLATLSEGTGIQLASGDLAAVVSQLLPGFAALAADSGQTFAAGGLQAPVPVRLDPHLVELAITNLVENACKFAPAGAHVALALRREGGAALLSVSDNGPGIPADELPRVFERFHRGRNTQGIAGTGLGLSIVQEAVARMGGTVGVTSAPGAGSTFTIRLPLLTA